jgi:hypothetical protein
MEKLEVMDLVISVKEKKQVFVSVYVFHAYGGIKLFISLYLIYKFLALLLHRLQ